MGKHRSLQVPKAHDRLTQTVGLDTSVGHLRYVSGARKDALARIGVETVRDLFLHTPLRYLDFSQLVAIGQAHPGDQVTIVATIDRVQAKRPRPHLDILEVYLVDATGVCRVTFFRQPWLKERFSRGKMLCVSGKVGFSYGFKTITPSFFEVVSDGEEPKERASSPKTRASSTNASEKRERRTRIFPIHKTTEGLSAAWMRRIISAALADAGDVVDFAPASLIARLGLLSEANALCWAHFPPSLAAAEAARRRLAFDELLCLQIGLYLRSLVGDEPPLGFAHQTKGPFVKAILAALPFELTGDQKRALRAIFCDMAKATPMRRLLQGDVGTGKTVVAALAFGVVADSGTQAAIMAPTSVLARQYARTLGPLLDTAHISWRLVSSATPAAERREIARLLAAGKITVLFGTTALLSEDMIFSALTLIVVDEQHRFGVQQRLKLAAKGTMSQTRPAPDLLAMTATPIPRTLALSVYGDVEVSTMVERPNPGSGVETFLLNPAHLDRAYTAIREAVAQGHQAYVVCSLVDESDREKMDEEEKKSSGRRLASAVSTQREFVSHVFPDLRVGLLHGRLSPQQKDEVMALMREGAIDVLVTTTVVEVGVDVPNATVMVILDADRFGLATLHQLRGRVGRGDHSGKAFLISEAKEGSIAYERLSALETVNDGFELAELDLKLRHEGEILGYRQSGEVTFRLVDLLGDSDLIKAAHDAAATMTRVDPGLVQPEHRLLVHEVRERYGERLFGNGL